MSGSDDRPFQLAAARGELWTDPALGHVVTMRYFDPAVLEEKDPELWAALEEGDQRFPDNPDRWPEGQIGWGRVRAPWRPDYDIDEEAQAVFEGAHPVDPYAGTALEGMKNGSWLEAYEPRELEFHLPGIIPEGLTFLVGPPKIGKSWLFLALALAIADGGKALGITVEKRPAFYMALEDNDRRMRSRCKKLLEEGVAIPHDFDYLCTLNPDLLYAAVEEYLDLHPTAKPLIMLDTLGKVMPSAQAGESPYNRDYRIGTALKRTIDARPGAALVVAHHDRKAESDDFVDKVSGSNGLAGAADTIIVLSRKRSETKGLLQVTSRDAEEAEYAVEMVGGTTWQLVGNSLERALGAAARHRAVEGLGDRMATIIEWVSKQTHPVGPAETAQALKIPPGQARTYLGRAVDTGRLARASRGLYTSVASVASDTSPGQAPQENATPTQQVLRSNGHSYATTNTGTLGPVGGEGWF